LHKKKGQIDKTLESKPDSYSWCGYDPFHRVVYKNIYHYPTSYVETSEYTIYNSDTFNVRDLLGLKQGKGMDIVLRETKDYSLLRPDTVINDYHIAEIFYGVYEDNLKIGVWKSYWENGKRKEEISFVLGMAVGPVNIYYDSGELMYEGEAQPGDRLVNRQVVLKKYTKGGRQTETITWYVDDLYLLNQ
jgi:hypothetical protein